MRRALAVAVLLTASAAAAEPLPQQPAAVIDPGSFAQAMPFTVPPSPEGVARLKIGPAALAAARADLGDLRVVDASRRQWPYVLRSEAGREEVAVAVSLSPGDRGRSRYKLALPVAPVAVDLVTLVIDRPYFDRGYRLLAEVPAESGRPDLLTSGRLARAAGGPASVDVAFPRRRVTALSLVVDDGDEAPLPITSARASIPLAELWIVAPPGPYTLLAGDPEAEAPRYEIARLRDRVLAASAPICAAGAIGPNPQHKQRLPLGKGMDQTALWAVMGLSVVLLVTLSLRLSRREADRDRKPNDQG